jgi:hypothetical protein
MGFESSGHRQWKVNAPGGAAPFEAGASQRWDGDRDLGLLPNPSPGAKLLTYVFRKP